jgi:DNA/RNA-binding domain of Phe-tRNA-synthetase-like protein
MFQLRIPDDIPQLLVAVVEAEDVVIQAASDELRRVCEDAVRRVLTGGMAGGEPRRRAVRDLLRSGGFKPSGRSKPAQEYLLRTVQEAGVLPAISNAVDLINLLSLQSGLPISLVSLDRVGPQLAIRFGRPGERFVFNRAGQELSLDGLLCLCAEREGVSEPVGTPVKDSLQAKVDETDRHVVACIYASRTAVPRDELGSWSEQLAAGFARHCAAAALRTLVLPE